MTLQELEAKLEDETSCSASWAKRAQDAESAVAQANEAEEGAQQEILRLNMKLSATDSIRNEAERLRLKLVRVTCLGSLSLPLSLSLCL